MPSLSIRFYLLFGVIVALYSLNFGNNAIWSTHEAYYAEAVREMLESGVWSQFYFNYDERFQKPPMTYWMMASSAYLFGLSEFSMRLPILLCSVLTVLIVYKIGELLFDKKTALASMLIFSVSLQFIWFRAYASPDIPLTLFFTIGMYGALRWLMHSKLYNWWLAVITTGFAALTKGFPYLILFNLIIVAYIWFSGQRLNRSQVLHYVIGVLASCLIGFSWTFFMLTTKGDVFSEIWFAETIQRFLDHPVKMGFWRSLVYYPVTLSWSLLPFSIYFFLALICSIRMIKDSRELLFPFIWLTIFLLVFTISSGKLPVYILQAHPAAALLTGYMLINYLPKNRWENVLWRLSFWTTFSALLAGLFLVINLFQLSAYYNLSFIFIAFVFFYFEINTPSRKVILLWFCSIALFTSIFTGLMPWVERFRPHQTIKQVLDDNRIHRSIPLYIEGRFLDNMPFYTQRKVVGGAAWTIDRIKKIEGEKLILARVKDNQTRQERVLWSGRIHAKGPEDHFFKFIRDCYREEKGDKSGVHYLQFDPFTLIPILFFPK